MFNKAINIIKLASIPCQENKYRPKFLESRFLLYYVISLLIFKIFILSLFIYLPRTVFLADITKTALINMVNKERESLGIQGLKENSKLDEAAYLKARNMMEKGYFAHQSPEGINPWHWFKEAGYDYKFAGENLAIGFLDSGEVYQAWLDSVSHKKNLLNQNYNETGIAVLKGSFQGNETNVVVQVFGTPQGRVISQPVAAKEEIPLVAGKTASTVGMVLSAFENKGNQADLTSNLFAFLISNYYGLFQKILYGSLFFIIIFFFINILIRFDIQHKDLIFKTLALILLLVIFIFIDKDAIIKTIPHDLRIY